MTDITLGGPVDVFYWRGSVPGELCGGRVSWACTYESGEPIAIPPFIDYAGAHVIVTNVLPEGEPLPSYVSPGVLTLTPTVTCPNPDPGGDPIATVLDPLTLTIAEEGPVVECPMNLSFEDGLNGWNSYNVTTVTTRAHEGSYSAELGIWGGWVQQEITGLTDTQATLDLDFYAYTESSGQSIEVNIQQYDSEGTRVSTVTEYPSVASGSWQLIPFSVPTHVDAVRLRMLLQTADQVMWVDDISVNFSCSEVILP